MNTYLATYSIHFRVSKYTTVSKEIWAQLIKIFDVHSRNDISPNDILPNDVLPKNIPLYIGPAWQPTAGIKWPNAWSVTLARLG
jgi:hypothetical protein